MRSIVKHDLYEVTVTVTNEEGGSTMKQLSEAISKRLRPMAEGTEEAVKATANWIWNEAGSPPHCHITVRLVGPTLGEFRVKEGEWEQTYEGDPED